MKFQKIHTCLLALMSACVSAASADERDTTLSLQHDPFALPAFFETPEVVESVDIVPVDLTIRAVLVSQRGTLININGSILGLHEFINDYELVALDREKAVLSRNGQRIVLTLPNTAAAVGSNRQQSPSSNP